jgi:glycosyltransferase involved in cell wall biosynthesis
VIVDGATDMSKRVAIFLVGGIGRGIDLQGIPAITALTDALARDFRVSVYSLLSPDPAFHPTGYAIHSPPSYLSGLTKKLRWLYLALQFVAEHRRDPYETLFSFWGYPMGPFVVALAKLVRRPSVIAILGAEAASVPSIGYGFLGRPTTRRLVLETCARASAVVVLSGEQRETLSRQGLRREVQVIPFGVDREMFKPRPKPLLPPLKILNVANLTAVKDQATLLRAFALLRRDTSARLRMVGPDHMNGALQRLAGELGLQDDVEFVGPVPYLGVPQHYHWADIFVMTSLSEGQCVALAEAAMSGVLLVSTPVGCIRDMGEGRAVVVSIGDPADIAAKIRAIVSDREQWDRKVAGARAWAEDHDLRWTVKRLTTVIEGASSWR